MTMSAPTSFSEAQRAAHLQPWTAATTHRFVQELWAGTLPEPVMTRYITQDYMFCDAFVALLGAAVSHADSPAARLAIARQLGFVATDEDGYFVRALERLNPSALALSSSSCNASPLPPTSAFLALMDAARGSYAEAITVLLVAEWLYLEWADHDRKVPEDWVHAEWIELHRGQQFEAWVRLLRSEVDRVAASAGAGVRAKMESVFAQAVQLELDFFDAAFD